MPEDNVAFIAALTPIMASNLSEWEAVALMGEEPPAEGASSIEVINWWTEAACRFRLKYAETIIRLRSA